VPDNHTKFPSENIRADVYLALAIAGASALAVLAVVMASAVVLI